MTCKIDTATLDDVPQLAELLGVLFSQEAEFQPDRATQERGLRAIIGDPKIGCILVARDGEEIIGIVNLLFTVSTALGERVAILEDVVVAPERRGGGIGSMLLDAAIDHARRAGCRRITLLTDRANAAAQRFYERRGFRLSEMVPMRLALTTDTKSGVRG